MTSNIQFDRFAGMFPGDGREGKDFMNAENEPEEKPTHPEGWTLSGGTRLAMRRSDWLPNWYVGWSPRNHNNNSEGVWEDWVVLATKILTENERLKNAPHIHKNNGKDDACFICGKDLRNEIHIANSASPTSKHRAGGI